MSLNDIALYAYIVNLSSSLFAFPYIKWQGNFMFAATVLYRHEKNFEEWSMKFSTHIKSFTTH